MGIIKNYNTWLLTESEGFEDQTLPSEPTSTEESPEYIENYINHATGEHFVVAKAPGHGSEDDLFAICKDDEAKAAYEGGDDSAADFIIFKPFEEASSVEDTEDVGGEGSDTKYGFTHKGKSEDPESPAEHEESDDTFDTLDELLDAIVTTIQTGGPDSVHKGEDDEVSGESDEPIEPESFNEEPEGYADAGMLKTQLEAKKREAEDKKKQYLTLEKGSDERKEIANDMIELNKEILRLEKQLTSKTSLTGKDEDEDDVQTDEELYEKKKEGKGKEKVENFFDWAKKKKGKGKEKEDDKKGKKEEKKTEKKK